MEPGRPRLRGRAGVYMGGGRGARNPAMRRTRSLQTPPCGGRGACNPRYAAGAEHATTQGGAKSGVFRSDTFNAKTSML